MTFKYRKPKKNMPPWQTILQTQSIQINTLTYLALTTILLTCCITFTSAHTSNCWWDPLKDKCIPCTICNQEKNLFALRPCQFHQDTICGTIQDLGIDWMYLHQGKELIKNELNAESNQDKIWDWQLTSFILVIVACFMFFVAATYVFLHHMNQWRRMERRLDKDVEELSAKLMAKLADNENGGSFVIENPIKVPNANPAPLKVHCIILDKYLVGKVAATQLPEKGGNVYIEETS